MVNRTCEDCGTTRKVNASSLPEGSYRCRQCRIVNQRGKWVRTCRDCGTTRKAHPESLPNGQYRCRQCRHINDVVSKQPHYHRDYKRKRNGTDHANAWVWHCLACGSAVQRRRGPEGKYCSACRYQSAGNPRKRARFHEVPYEPINPKLVFIRDKWICGICRKKVDQSAGAPDPMRASLDHIVPISRGGGHTYDNVQCSHLRCNVSKNAGGGGEQLILIGLK